MKRCYSVLTLAVRSNLYPFLILLLLMAAAQAAAFGRLLPLAASELLSLEDLLKESRMAFLAAGIFLLCCLRLCLTGCELSGSRPGLTLGRLSLGERQIVLLWALFYSFCFLFFWAAELATVLALSRWYLGVLKPEYSNAQTIFLASYRSSFFHSLLPLEDAGLYLRNLCLCAGLGVSTAVFAPLQRRGKRHLAPAFLAAFTLLTFSRKPGSPGFNLFVTFMALVFAAHSLWRLWKETGHETL